MTHKQCWLAVSSAMALSILGASFRISQAWRQGGARAEKPRSNPWDHFSRPLGEDMTGHLMIIDDI